MAARPVLMTVSGRIEPGLAPSIARGDRPRVDFLEVAKICGADLIDYDEARRVGGWFGALLERVAGPNVMLAWACFRNGDRYAMLFTDGEQVGIPLALLERFLGSALRPRPAHLMLTHSMAVRKKMVFFDLLRVHRAIDFLVVYASYQRQFIQERWGYPGDRIAQSGHAVDTAFFSLEQVTPNATPRPMICAVGREARDYQTMLRAVGGLDADVVINAESNWSRRSKIDGDRALPPNVTIVPSRRSFRELRQLYADSRFVVVPLRNVSFPAGNTTILEAMSMSRAVICTRVPGQRDFIEHGVNGLYVPPNDPAALRGAIGYLLEHPDEAERMGRAGRRCVEQQMQVEHYVDQLNHCVHVCLSRPTRMAWRADEP